MPQDPLAALRPHLAAVWADRDRLVARVAAEVIARVPTYATTPSSEVWIGMTRILARIAEGDPFGAPTAEDLDAGAGTGIQGARAGIAAEDLVEAVLLGAREVEAEVMARAEAAGVPADVRLSGVRAAREWAETVAVAAARAHLRAGTPEGRDAATDLIAALHPDTPISDLAALATRARLDPGATHHVVVARSAGTDALDDVDAARLRFAHAGAAWAVRDGALVGVLPSAPAPMGDLVIGAAGPAALSGLGGALLDADRAARAARDLLGPGCHDLDTLGLLVPLHQDRALRERLDRRRLGPLRGEARHDLVRTVRVWQRLGQVDAVARELAVHPNTVRNRLARIDALLPDWRTPQAQAETWAALVLDAAPGSENL